MLTLSGEGGEGCLFNRLEQRSDDERSEAGHQTVDALIKGALAHGHDHLATLCQEQLLASLRMRCYSLPRELLGHHSNEIRGLKDED